MIRYLYNQQVVPPAPFVHATVRRPGSDQELADLAAQLDSAADMTVLPLRLVHELGLVPSREVVVSGFGGRISTVQAFLVQVRVRDLQWVIVEALASPDEPFILLGRDFMNHLRILLDGPNLALEVG